MGSVIRLTSSLALILSAIAWISFVQAAADAPGELRVPSKPSRRQFSAVAPQGQASDDIDQDVSEQLMRDGLLQGGDDTESAQVKSTDSSSSSPIGGLLKGMRPRVHFSLNRAAPAEKPKPEKKSFMSGKFLKDSVRSAYRSTKNYVKEVSDSLALMNAKAHLSLAIDDAKDDIKSVRKEYSLFTVTLSPVIESALNYIGTRDLNNLKHSSPLEDPFDFRLDALHALAFGYEFMRLLNAWRESMLPVHEAYKQYVQTMKDTFSESDSPKVDNDLFVQLKTIHKYLLLTGWLSYDELSREPREKLEYLMRKVNTESPNKDFERTYLRKLLSLSRIFEKTRDKFETERRHVVDSLAALGVQSDAYPDVDEFFDQFRDALDAGQLPEVEWRVPSEMEHFLESLEPELERNPLVYDKHFLFRLNKGL